MMAVYILPYEKDFIPKTILWLIAKELLSVTHKSLYFLYRAETAETLWDVVPQRRLSRCLGFIIYCPYSWASIWGRVSCCLVQCIVGVCGEGFSRLTPHWCSVHCSSQVSRIYSRCALMLTKGVCLVHILQILGLWSHLLFLFRHSSQTNSLVLSIISSRLRNLCNA